MKLTIDLNLDANTDKDIQSDSSQIVVGAFQFYQNFVPTVPLLPPVPLVSFLSLLSLLCP